MSSDADAHKVGLIPVTLMVSGNIMGSGVFLLPANLASTGGIAIYGWLVTIIGALGLSMVYAKMSFLDPSPGGSYAYARRCFGPFLGYQTNINVQTLLTEAILTENRDRVYHAAMMDPHTAAVLGIDEIYALVDDLIAAHGDWLPGWLHR